MTMTWLRLYHDARTDKRLSVLTLAERGVWVNLLCYASEQEERGTFDATDRYMLAIECADGDEEALASCIEKLVRTRHLVECGDGRLAFRTFEARQYDKPSARPERVAERVRALRARRSNARNAQVTRGNAIDTDTDTDSDPSPAIDHPDAAADRARAREAGGGGEDASRRGEPDDAAPEVATPAMPRALVAKVAKAARLHSCDLTALADVLGPYHARDPAWLIGQAAAFADWYADPRAGDPKRKPKHPTIRHLGSWLAQPVARAAPTPEATGAMNGATTNGPSEPTPAAAAARRDQDEYDRYWAELRRLGVGGVNGYRAPKRPAAADVAERPGASGLAQLGTGPPASG